eukprot:CAMPEP_0172752826 /NCGR_PEP_ID=MMETSP1074-20121228/154653_1 /TAXON_ID=2916 /ORGANISM="Ceratium fusus, Strain PA161109" /LENGTH=198 /DNA_ID=CAMNT_0013585385 /DNA_START=5 /DNA_END=598 /DNA_ORIENTATION=+
MNIWAKRSACCCPSCCIVAGLIFGIALLVNLISLESECDALLPGDKVRRGIQPHLASALSTGDFSKVQEQYTHGNSAMLIGNGNGVLWEQSNGFIDLDEPYSVASETKVITALAIYRVMAKPVPTLSLLSKPSDFFPDWPTTGNAGKITMAHLLAFTSGIAGTAYKAEKNEGCARPGYSESTGDDYWMTCIKEMAKYD